MMLDRPGEPLLVLLTSTGYAVRFTAANFGGSPRRRLISMAISVEAGSIAITLNGRSAGVTLNETGLVKVTL